MSNVFMDLRHFDTQSSTDTPRGFPKKRRYPQFSSILNHFNGHFHEFPYFFQHPASLGKFPMTSWTPPHLPSNRRVQALQPSMLTYSSVISSCEKGHDLSCAVHRCNGHQRTIHHLNLYHFISNHSMNIRIYQLCGGNV